MNLIRSAIQDDKRSCIERQSYLPTRRSSQFVNALSHKLQSNYDLLPTTRGAVAWLCLQAISPALCVSVVWTVSASGQVAFIGALWNRCSESYDPYDPFFITLHPGAARFPAQLYIQQLSQQLIRAKTLHSSNWFSSSGTSTIAFLSS